MTITEFIKIIDDKDSLPIILEEVYGAFLTSGTDELEDELDKKNTSRYFIYRVNERRELTISIFNRKRRGKCEGSL